jgi:hypothetical protein
MKKIFYLSILAFLALAVFQACEKDLPMYLEFTPYTYEGLDEDGGNWKPILLDSATIIGIPAPEEAGSAAYQAELADLKSASSSLTSEQEKAVAYWSGDGLVRWNEIARELAAKYNLPPPPKPDGTYGAPDPANPANIPNFPFAHPPYASRMFAYWSTAQFDALIAAWHYKYEYNRPSAYKADSGIITHLPQNDLPGYPSEGAVVAAVSKRILSAMFPLEKAYIEDLATEHLNSLQWAGISTESDIVWGDSLGRGVAGKFLARAGSDGMKAAQTPKPISDSLRVAAKERFGWQWDNLESPARPVGIAPFFGRVKPWCIPGVEVVRPPVPPAPGSAAFNVAAEELKEISKGLTDEQRKIANFWADGPSTYTPPGHWNRFACDEIVGYRLSPIRAARVLAYMNMAIMDAGISCWDTKYYYHYARPIQAIEGFKTILGTPNFPAYTSGHSTFSAAAATVLGHFFPAEAAKFDNWAMEAGESRIYGGIHFRFDSEMGNTQGKACGGYTIDVAKADGGE